MYLFQVNKHVVPHPLVTSCLFLMMYVVVLGQGFVLLIISTAIEPQRV